MKPTGTKYHAPLAREFIQLFLFCLLAITPFSLLAQSFPVVNFTPRDGLPSLSVRCFYKDTKGLMWIGTDAGLCTWDGKSFHTYGASDGIAANRIWAITQDNRNRFWIGTYGDGVYRYDGRRFVRFSVVDGLPDDRVRALYYSRKFDCLIVGTDKGIRTIRGDSVLPPPAAPPGIDPRPGIMALVEDGDQILVMAYNAKNPFRYDPVKNTMVSLNDGGHHYPALSFSAMITSKGDTVLSDGFDGIRISSKNRMIRNDTLGQVFGLVEDNRGDLWISAWSTVNVKLAGGVYRYDGKTFRNYKQDFGIQEREIFALWYDREQDLIWIGTETEGMFRVSLNYLTTYPPDYFKLETQRIRNLYLDSAGSLWISGKRELIRMQPDGTWSFLDKQPLVREYRKFWRDPTVRMKVNMATTLLNARDLPDKEIPAFLRNTDFNFFQVLDDTGHSRLYTCELGLFRHDLLAGTLDYLGPEGAELRMVVAGDTLVTSDEYFTGYIPNYRHSWLSMPKIWGSGWGFPHIFNSFAEPRQVVRPVSHGGRIWYPTRSSGLWTSRGTEMIHLDAPDSIIPKGLSDICFDSLGNILLGSLRGEIVIGAFDGSQMRISHRITPADGLRGNMISWLVMGPGNHLWAGTNEGVNCIYLDSLWLTGRKVIRFLKEENEYAGTNASKAVIDTAGNLWISGTRNLIRLNTRDMLNHSVDPGKMVMKSISVNQKPVDSLYYTGIQTATILAGKNLELPHRENDLIFEFDLLNYRDPQEDLFRYKLDNYDANWNKWSQSRRAVYTNLPPGRYRFMVESFNQRTLRESEHLIASFTIRHPWWGLWHLQVAAVILVIFIVFMSVRRYIRNERDKQIRKSEVERRIVQLEMEALQAQMNPHFVFNCVNDIQYYILDNQMDKALEFLSDFSKVVRQTFKHASMRLVTIDHEIDFLSAYLRLEHMRFADLFNYEIGLPDADVHGNIRIPPMLVQPFVENAIRHGFKRPDCKGHLVVSFGLIEHDLLKVTVCDDGIGRKQSVKHHPTPSEANQPHSTQITENRISLLNTADRPGRFRVVFTDLLDGDRPAGLRVELFLPVE